MELEKACLIASLLRKSETENATAVPQIRSELKSILLIGSDFPHLLIPIQPVHVGPSGGLVAICTSLGWTL